MLPPLCSVSRLIAMIEPIARAKVPAKERLRQMAEAHLSLLLADMPMQKVAVQGLERYLFQSSGFRYVHTLREINKMRDDYEHQLDAKFAGARGYVDAILTPEETRDQLRLVLRVVSEYGGPHLGQFVLPPMDYLQT